MPTEPEGSFLFKKIRGAVLDILPAGFIERSGPDLFSFKIQGFQVDHPHPPVEFGPPVVAPVPDVADGGQIGRASCRERV